MTKTPTRDRVTSRHTVRLAAPREMRALAGRDEGPSALAVAGASVVFVVEPATEGRL